LHGKIQKRQTGEWVNAEAGEEEERNRCQHANFVTAEISAWSF